MIYRKLGRTGIDVGVIGLGLEHLLDKEQDVVTNTIRTAVNGGVNYIDCLSHPENFFKIGNALEGYRNKVIITYLATPDVSVEENIKNFDYFRGQVRTEYVDIFIIACCDKVSVYDTVTGDNGVLLLAKKLKSEGKIGFIGFSTHVSDIAFRVINNGSFDILMYPINPAFDIITEEEKYVSNDLGHLWEAAYHYKSTDVINGGFVRKDVFSECIRNNIGLVAMKPFAAGWLFRPDMNTGFTPLNLVSYVLSQNGVSTVVPGCASTNEMEQILTYFTCPDSDLNFSDAVSKSRWSVKGTCLYCSHCLPCTSDIDIAAINKLVDSLTSNIDIDILKVKYNELKNKASSCVKCGECEKRCPFDVAVTTKMKIAAQMFESE